VTGRTQRRFWKCFESLPEAVQKLAREKYALWKRDPYHPSLHFEERRNQICVIRIGNHYRAVELREGDIVWFWIGTHEDYNRFRF
jgi:hypothetical protein